MSLATLSIDIDPALIARLDSVASVEQTHRDELVAQAIDQFLAIEEYHIACIHESRRQADAGMLIPLKDVIAETKKWARKG